jgi:hypothetical protein
MSDAWEPRILKSMKPGCVTFAWDDGEVRTIEAPESALDEMKSAWAWIDGTVKQLVEEKGRPRTICFKLSNGQFRGLTFPDGKPGILD